MQSNSIPDYNQRTDSPESRLVYTRLEVALQILERKIYKNTKISSLYSESLLFFIQKTTVV